jgi:hypothetical protein
MARLNQSLGAELDVQLESRIGVSTGEVVVGAGDEALLGDVMNTAARLQSAAEPGDVLVGEPTWRLVRDAVIAEAVGPVNVKGKAEPVPAWRVAAVHAAPRVTTPFVGRDRYMRMLDEALADAIDARSSVLVTILAPPGVGKSRLAEAFAAGVRERATVLVGQTPSYGDGVTFAPLVELLAQAAGRPSGDADVVAMALRERMATQTDGASVGDRLAQFLGVGDALGADTSWAVRRLLEVLASERPPLVVILEDVHWAEPPMLDLADAVVERAHGPILFLCLARPELLEQRPTWAAAKPRAITTTLTPLSAEDTRRIGELLLGPDVRRRPRVRDGRGQPAVCGAADGDARGSRIAGQRPVGGIQRRGG